ncbi:SDR family oxidoreductase, partial [Acinetobacter baumannii]
TAKAALNQMMVSVAHLLARKVRVNSVLIGTVLTAGYADAGLDEAVQQRMKHPDTLTGRPGTPEDGANAVLGLCSPGSSW